MNMTQYLVTAWFPRVSRSNFINKTWFKKPSVICWFVLFFFPFHRHYTKVRVLIISFHICTQRTEEGTSGFLLALVWKSQQKWVDKYLTLSLTGLFCFWLNSTWFCWFLYLEPSCKSIYKEDCSDWSSVSKCLALLHFECSMWNSDFIYARGM